MKLSLCKIVTAFCAVILLAAGLTGCGSDPNVDQGSGSSKAYKVSGTGGSSETEKSGYHSYGSGKTDPVTVNGVKVDVCAFALRSYELAYMMAQKNFNSVKDIQIDALTQYGFAHTLFENLNETNDHAMQYRTASEEDIKKVLKKHFGTDDIDITKSVLYNPEKKLFEMWIPEYGTNIYYTIDAVNVEGNRAEITTTFFNELKRETMLGRTVITAEVKDGAPVIAALKTE